MNLFLNIVLIKNANVCRLKYLLIVSILFVSNAAANGKLDSDTLALVGNSVISTESFVKLYNDKLRETGLPDNIEIRTKYLQNIIDDQILIDYAKSIGIGKTQDAQNEIERIKLQELLNEFSRRNISPTVTITENYLHELFFRFNKKVKVSHLYAPTKEKAESLYNELLNGRKFEELAKQNFDDPVLQANGGSLGFISIDETDPDFEDAAFSMSVGEISAPIKTVQGYSIIRIDDIKINPLGTEGEFLKVRDRLKTFAHKRLFEKASKNFAHELNSKLKVKFNEPFISTLFKRMTNNSTKGLFELDGTSSGNELDKIVVSSQLGDWNLRTVIDEMKIVTGKQKKWIRTEENLKEFISGLINRKYIEMLAVSEKLHETDSYNQKVEYLFDTYLLTAVENTLKNKIAISPDTIAAYYSTHMDNYKSEPEIHLGIILLENQSSVDTVMAALENGESFGKLAKEYSVQKATAITGGDAGYFKQKELGYLGEEFFNLDSGAWAGPFRNDDEFLFVKNLGIKSEQLTLEESAGQIEQLLISFKYYNEREKIVKSIKEKMHVQIFSKKLNELKPQLTVDIK